MESGGKNMRRTRFALHIPAGTTIAITSRVQCNSQTFEVVDLGAPVSLEPIRTVFLEVIA